jgi:hypothetical protein
MQKIQSKSAWTKESLLKSEFWGYNLSSSQANQLMDAVRYFKNSGFTYSSIEYDEIEIPMFPLGKEWVELFNAIRDNLETGTGAVLLKNLPVAPLQESDVAIMHAGISKHIGHVVPQAGGRVRSATRGHGRRFGKVVAEMSGSVPVNGKQSNNKFHLHTDVCDVISLLCIINDAARSNEGQSIIASALAIYNEMVETSPELAQALLKPIPRIWTVSKDLYCELPVWKFYGNGDFTTQLTPVYNEVSQLNPNAPTIPKIQIDAINKLQEIGYRIGLQFSLAPGECYFLNNHLVYHGRGSWTHDPAKPASRVMLRTWLSPYNNRALPDEPVFHEMWGSIKPNAPRGRAHMVTTDPQALEALAAMNKRVESLTAEKKYDYYNLFDSYETFMAGLGRKP